MSRFISKNILYFILAVFILAMSIQTIMTVWRNKQEQYKMALQYSQLLSSYAMINRNYYQHLYLTKAILLTKNTLSGLPAYSSSIIAKKFSKANINNIEIRTVSDTPRNEANMADNYEMKAIQSFKADKNKKMFFKDFKDFYQYATPLKITKSCLKCHGKISDAPKYIRENYKKAYGYKLGDIRGIMSIKIPKFEIERYFNSALYSEIIKNIILFAVLLILVLYISRKNSNFSKVLNAMVEEKTKKLIEQEKHILYISMHDELTGLKNRLCLKEDMKLYRIGKMAYINIDGFKNINDFYGVKTGDTVLKKYALYLKRLVETCGLSIYKLPSDEFALFCHKENITNELFLINIKKIITKLNRKIFTIENQDIILSSTVGVCFERNQIMSKTDIALKKAKKENIEIVVYDKNDNIEEQIQHNFKMIKKIKKAIEKDTIIPFYQPIYDIKTQKITKYESLARIIDENGAIIPPNDFLGIAKQTRLYPSITNSMIRKTFDMANKHPDISFSINLSSADMQDENIISFIKKSLKTVQNPKKILFEILESESIEKYQTINHFIAEFKDNNCKFAIDDFGSGYSNFAHITELSVDFLKIDATLVKNIYTDLKSYEVVKTIVGFAKNINVKTIAEYVESKEILDKLIELDVDFAQGYHIGKPKESLVTDLTHQT